MEILSIKEILTRDEYLKLHPDATIGEYTSYCHDINVYNDTVYSNNIEKVNNFIKNNYFAIFDRKRDSFVGIISANDISHKTFDKNGKLVELTLNRLIHFDKYINEWTDKIYTERFFSLGEYNLFLINDVTYHYFEKVTGTLQKNKEKINDLYQLFRGSLSLNECYSKFPNLKLSLIDEYGFTDTYSSPVSYYRYLKRDKHFRSNNEKIEFLNDFLDNNYFFYNYYGTLLIFNGKGVKIEKKYVGRKGSYSFKIKIKPEAFFFH